MATSETTGDPRGGERVRLSILGHVMDGPMVLGALVAHIEGLMLGELNGSPRTIARTLHEMQRAGHIILANDGRRWRVSLGPQGRDGFTQLMRARQGDGPAAAGRI